MSRSSMLLQMALFHSLIWLRHTRVYCTTSLSIHLWWSRTLRLLPCEWGRCERWGVCVLPGYSFPPDVCPGEELLGRVVALVLVFQGNFILFSKATALVSRPISSVGGSLFSTAPQHSLFVDLSSFPWPHHGMRDLSSGPGIKPVPPAVEGQSLRFWATRRAPAFISFALGDWSKEHYSGFMSTNVLPVCSSRSFVMSCFIFGSLSHFEFIFTYGGRVCSNFIDLMCDCLTFPTMLAEETVFSPLYILASFVED